MYIPSLFGNQAIGNKKIFSKFCQYWFYNLKFTTFETNLRNIENILVVNFSNSHIR